jgi:hypothetical protein
MLPSTVGEMRKLLADFPDELPFDLDVRAFGNVMETSLEMLGQMKFDGTTTKWFPVKVLTLVVQMDD